MRRFVLGLLVLAAAAAGVTDAARAAAVDNFYTRVRANDAPIGGRFSIYGYFLDSLEVPVEVPEVPGRLLILLFRDANGKDSFVIPGDLRLEDDDRNAYTSGFLPVGPERLAGLLPEGESRLALWWVPHVDGEFSWSEPGDLTLHYGFDHQRFLPLEGDDLASVREFLPWDRIEGRSVPPGRRTDTVIWAPDPLAFDKTPEVKEFRQPVYPATAKLYNFKGTVQVVVRIDEKGFVTDAFVLRSDASHDLNVSALAAVTRWTFRAARKDDVKVPVEVVIPIRFTEERH